MELTTVEQDGVQVVEGEPGRPLMARVEDANRVVEACLSYGAGAALLYAPNLTAGFFDLSSGEAGAILQKLRNYHILLAVVCPPGSVQYSRRFGEVLAEERQAQFFKVFETRAAALAWLGMAARA